MARSIQKIHAELEQINEEISQLEIQSRPKIPEPPPVNSLSQWFDIYGRPNMTEEKKDLMTKFEKNSKIYGGTKHKEYPSFKTTSTVMVKGRLTR